MNRRSNLKPILYLVVVSSFTLNCATRRFNINSDPSNAKVYYQSRLKNEFIGFTPLTQNIKIQGIGPASKFFFEKEGFKKKEVNIGGFTGTDISLHITMEPMEPKELMPHTSAALSEQPVLNFTEDAQVKSGDHPEEHALDVKSEIAVIKSTDEAETFELVGPPVPTHLESSDAIPAEKVAVAPIIEKPVSSPKPSGASTEIQPALPANEFNLIESKIKQLEETLDLIQRDQSLVKDAGGGGNTPVIDRALPATRGEKSAVSNKALGHIFNAQRLIQQHRLNEALIETYKAVNIDDQLAYAYAIQGSIYFLKRDYLSARSSWERAVQLDPTNYEVINILNRLKARMGAR